MRRPSRIGVACLGTSFSEGEPIGFKNLLFTASIASEVNLVGIFEVDPGGVELNCEGENGSFAEVEVRLSELPPGTGDEGEDRE